MTSFADYTPSAGGPRLLPAGVGNYTIVSAVPEVNKFTNARQIIFTLNGIEGSGVYEMDLQASSPQYQDIVDKVMLSVMKVTGFQPSNPNTPIDQLHAVLLPEFIGALPSLAGTVVELNVQHKAYDRKTKEGSPMIDQATGEVVKGKRQTVYFNKLVQGGGGRSAAASPATEFVAVGAPDDSDIPF